MSSRDGIDDRARRQARERVTRAIADIRRARVSAGMSQRALAARTCISRSRVSRIERGLEPGVPAELLGRLAASVGLDLAMRTYPGADPGFDAPQRRVFARFMGELGPMWFDRTEVGLPIIGDLRAWDAVVNHLTSGFEVHVEVETRIDDIQALFRRLARKRRDGQVQRLVLVVADTRSNRDVLAAAAADVAASFPVDARQAWRMLRVGMDPGGDVLLLV